MMSLQTWSHIAIFIGVVLTAAGGLGSYYFGKRENEKKEVRSAAAQMKLQNRINALQSKLTEIQSNTESIDQRINLIFESSETKKNKWNEVKVSAPVFADYIMILFRSSSGNIAGNARIKGAREIYPFSTKVNNRIPLAVHNLWLPDEKQYMSDPILEYEITETSDEKNTLSILSAGYRMSSGM